MIVPEYTLSLHDLKICESYKVHKGDMKKILKKIRKDNEMAEEPIETIVFDRCLTSLKLEWVFHNFLYMVGYERDRTKDCDLDNPCDHPEWMYILLGILVWLFVW